MSTLPLSLRALTLGLAAGLLAAPAFAQEAPATSAVAAPTVASAAIVAAPVTTPDGAASTATASPFSASALADDTLGTVAGREDTHQVSMANLNAGVSHNSVGANSTTGDARISDNAFQNMSGLSILNVNTGNNVAINAAMNVNISITPGQ